MRCGDYCEAPFFVEEQQEPDPQHEPLVAAGLVVQEDFVEQQADRENATRMRVRVGIFLMLAF